MKKKYIFRDVDKFSKRKNPFVFVSKVLVEDERLSHEDIGIMTVLLSNKDDWNQNIGALRAKLGIPEKRLNKRLAHLKSLGYVERNKYKAHDGTWFWETIVREVPNKESQKPLSGKGHGPKPEGGGPSSGEGGNLTSNILNKEESIKNILTNKIESLNKEELLKPSGLKGISDRKSNDQYDNNGYVDDLPF